MDDVWNVYRHAYFFFLDWLVRSNLSLKTTLRETDKWPLCKCGQGWTGNREIQEFSRWAGQYFGIMAGFSLLTGIFSPLEGRLFWNLRSLALLAQDICPYYNDAKEWFYINDNCNHEPCLIITPNLWHCFKMACSMCLWQKLLVTCYIGIV